MVVVVIQEILGVGKDALVVLYVVIFCPLEGPRGPVEDVLGSSVAAYPW